MYKYYCSERTHNYKNEVEHIIRHNKYNILNFFGLDETHELNFSVYIYNTIWDLKKGLEKRGFKDMPDYMCACFKDEDNSINLFEPKDNPGLDEWSKDEYEDVIIHELIHAIQFSVYGSQPEWLTEGIAKYLDGTYKRGIQYLLENYINKNRIPPMEELQNEFGKHEYDSYDYAYLMVDYLIRKHEKTNFLKIIGNKEELDKVSKNLTHECINYYTKKYLNY